MSLVSVVIPTQNRAELLKRAVKSVIKQTYTEWEIIIIDDASADNTRQTAEEYIKSGFRYFHFTDKKGGAAARNKGIKEAKGEYIAFLDDDDEWLPEKLEKQMEAFNKYPEVALCYTGRHVDKGEKTFPGFLRKYSFKKPAYEDHFRAIMSDNFIGITSTVIIKRDVLVALDGFDENLPGYQDYELFIRVLRENKSYGIDEPLVIYHLGSDSHVSLNRKNIIKAEKYLAEKYGSDPYYTLLKKGLKRINMKKMFKSFSYAKEVLFR